MMILTLACAKLMCLLALHSNESSNKKRLHQLIKGVCTFNMRTMSTVGKYLQTALGSALRFLCMRYRKHRIGLTPHDQHWTAQSCQGIAQVNLLPSFNK